MYSIGFTCQQKCQQNDADQQGVASLHPKNRAPLADKCLSAPLFADSHRQLAVRGFAT